MICPFTWYLTFITTTWAQSSVHQIHLFIPGHRCENPNHCVRNNKFMSYDQHAYTANILLVAADCFTLFTPCSNWKLLWWTNSLTTCMTFNCLMHALKTKATDGNSDGWWWHLTIPKKKKKDPKNTIKSGIMLIFNCILFSEKYQRGRPQSKTELMIQTGISFV